MKVTLDNFLHLTQLTILNLYSNIITDYAFLPYEVDRKAAR